MNFKLKRKAGTSTHKFGTGMHDVYKNYEDNGYDYYINSKNGRYYFNLLDSEIDYRGQYLSPHHWEVVKIKEEKKLDQFKVGETYLCTKGTHVFTQGKLYFVLDDKSASEPYIVSDSGTKWVKSDIEGIYSEFEKFEEPKPKEPKYNVTMTAETPAELRDKAYKLFELAEQANDARLAYGDAQSKLEAYLKEVK